MKLSFTPTDLATRSVSSFPLSIGTGLAFESLFDNRINPYDTDRQIPKRIDLKRYPTMYINIFTLFRNMVGSIPGPVFAETNSGQFVAALLEEISIIESLFKEEGRGLCKPIFYVCTYDDVYKKPPHPSCQVRHDKTQGQKYFMSQFNMTVKLLLQENHDIITFNSTLTGHPGSSLILTHVPYDLLSYTEFNQLDLLESHTGVLKKRHHFGSKYLPIGERFLNHLPFCKKLLWVFGDKVLIQPMPYKLRVLIYEIAEKRNWTPMTTRDKIQMDLELDIKEPFVLEVLRAIK